MSIETIQTVISLFRMNRPSRFRQTRVTTRVFRKFVKLNQLARRTISCSAKMLCVTFAGDLPGRGSGESAELASGGWLPLKNRPAEIARDLLQLVIARWAKGAVHQKGPLTAARGQSRTAAEIRAGVSLRRTTQLSERFLDRNAAKSLVRTGLIPHASGGFTFREFWFRQCIERCGPQLVNKDNEFSRFSSAEFSRRVPKVSSCLK